MNLEQRVLILIGRHSKTWLSEKLGITRPTLDIRLDKGNWKKSEMQSIILLSK